jgi:hypothetical protein
MKKCLLLILMIFSMAFSQWSQSEFVIGCWVDPPLITTCNKPTLDPADIAHNQSILSLLQECGINLLTCTGPIPCNQYRRDELSFVSIFPQLKIIVNDERFLNPYTSAVANDIVQNWGGNGVANSFYNTYSNGTAMRNAIYGLGLFHEPHPADLGNYFQWQTYVHQNDPTKTCWFILLPYNNLDTVPDFPTWADYDTYVTSVFDTPSTRIVSFDYYPFRETGWENQNFTEPWYFRNHELFAQRSSSTGKPFWAHSHTGANTIHAPFSSPKLNFMAWAPIIYGAKGIIYYTYQQVTTLHPPLTVYGLVDGTNSPLPSYNCAKDINTQIKNMSSILMKLQWQKTIHGSSTDPNSGEIGLTTIDNSTPLNFNGDNSIKSAVRITSGDTANRSSLAIGIFKDGADDYLMPLNKRIRYVGGGAWQENTDISADYNVKNIVYPLEFNKDAAKWKILPRSKNKYYSNTTSFNLQISTGDAKLIKLAPGNVLPLLNLTLTNLGTSRGITAEADSYATHIILTDTNTSSYSLNDNFDFANKLISNGFQVDVHLDSADYSAGIMIRSSHDANGPMVYLYNTKDNTSQFSGFLYRLTKGSDYSSSPGSYPFQKYLRITRFGKSISGYISPDGINYTKIGNISLSSGPLYVGLSSYWYGNYGANTAAFSNFSIRAYDPMTPINTLLLGD